MVLDAFLAIYMCPFFPLPFFFLEQSCNSSFFMCKNGKCIPQEDVCNTKQDCGDGSDERNCHINECLSKKVSGCSQDCQDLPVGYKVGSHGV